MLNNGGCREERHEWHQFVKSDAIRVSHFPDGFHLGQRSMAFLQDLATTIQFIIQGLWVTVGVTIVAL